MLGPPDRQGPRGPAFSESQAPWQAPTGTAPAQASPHPGPLVIRPAKRFPAAACPRPFRIAEKPRPITTRQPRPANTPDHPPVRPGRRARRLHPRGRNAKEPANASALPPRITRNSPHPLRTPPPVYSPLLTARSALSPQKTKSSTFPKNSPKTFSKPAVRPSRPTRNPAKPPQISLSKLHPTHWE